MSEARVAVVTGGSRGIGRATVLEFVRAGLRVVFSSRAAGPEVDEVLATAELLGGAGCVFHVAADVGKEADVAALFTAARAGFGCVDVVISNAGTSRGSLLVSLEDDDLDAVLETNLTGAFLVARGAVRAFTEADATATTTKSARGPGTLVTVGSLAQHGAPANAVYAASKGALVGLTQALVTQHGDRVHALLVVVGFVETSLTADLPARTRSLLVDACPQKRGATPEEIAIAIVGLALLPGAPLVGRPLYLTGGLAEIPA